MNVMNYILGLDSGKEKPLLSLTDFFERIIEDISVKMPEFSYIANPHRILVCLARANNTRKSGVYAKIVPMNFPNGSPFKEFDGQLYSMPQILTPNGNIMYIIYIYLPRFFLQDFDKRLLTIIHELYHISDEFDGTIRMFGGKPHGNSRERFNRNLLPFAERYASVADNELMDILKSDYKDLQKKYTVTGRCMSIPKAIRLSRLF